MPCLTFKGPLCKIEEVYMQKPNTIFIIKFSFFYNHLKLGVTVFLLL